MTEDMSGIWIVTFVLELPFDLGITDQMGGLMLEERSPARGGWPTEAIEIALQLPVPGTLEDGSGPGTRWMMRREFVRTHVPLQAADRAFADWRIALLSRKARIRRSLTLARWRLTGIRKPITVVALSRYISDAELPTGPDDPGLRSLYDRARADFDRVINLLGISSGLWWVRPITERELSGLVPVMMEFVGPHEPSNGEPIQRVGRSFLLAVHDNGPNLTDEPYITDAEMENSQAMLAAYNRGDLAFLPVFELIHEAEADVYAGKHAQAAVLAASAVEMLTSVLLSRGGALAGWDENTIERALRARFRNRVEDHLSKLLGEPIDITDLSKPWGSWWARGYAVRNAYVHEARIPTRLEVIDGWKSMRELVEWARERVEAVPPLSPLRDQFAVFRPTHPD